MKTKRYLTISTAIVVAAFSVKGIISCRQDSNLPKPDNPDKPDTADTSAVTPNQPDEVVKTVSLDREMLVFSVFGDTSTLRVIFSPDSAFSESEKAVKWTSSNPAIAKVSAAGLVTAVAAGEATVSATVAGGKTMECSVAVSNDGLAAVVVKTDYGTDTIHLVNVEGGTFIMGCYGERDVDHLGWCNNSEKPYHSVTMSSFKIGKFEVTQKLWYVVMGEKNNVKPESNQGDNFPAANLSPNLIKSFVEKLNACTKMNFNLPTEAQWEYAARGGNQSKGYIYSGDNNIYNVFNNSMKFQPVGSKAPNELGIYDMSGSVKELCADNYQRSYEYAKETLTDPVGTLDNTNKAAQHPVRGGGADDGGGKFLPLRNATRAFNSSPDKLVTFLGIRLVLK